MNKQQKRIVATIRQRFRDDKPLNISAMKRDQPRLLQQVMSLKHFRGWRKALLAAGIAYSDIRVEYRDYLFCAECGRELRTLPPHVAAAHSMTTEEYRQRHRGHETTCDEIRANCTPSLRRAPHWEKVWSREYLIDYLIYKHEQHEDISPWTVYRNEPAVHANAKSYFGSYRAAVEAAGLEYGRIRHIGLTENWTKEKVVSRIRELHRERPLTSTADIRRRDSKLYDSCMRYFGTQVAAIEAAGIPYALLPNRRSNKLDKRTIVRTIRVLDSAGMALRPAALESHLNGQATALLAAARRRFGSWERAVQIAGIDDRKHRDRRES